MDTSNITKTIDFLYKRIESSETMAEKERILELFWDESKKIRARKNLNEMKHLRKLLVAIRDKYHSDYNDSSSK
jgi:DNA-binding SARP family transcriptional activator